MDARESPTDPQPELPDDSVPAPTPPSSWYVVVTAEGEPGLEAYYNFYDAMNDPKLERMEDTNSPRAKLTYSGLDGLKHVDDVVPVVVDVMTTMTGVLRMQQDPAPLALVHIVAVHESGEEDQYIPKAPFPMQPEYAVPTEFGRTGEAHRTIEQIMVERTLLLNDEHIRRVFRYMNRVMDYPTLFKVVEVICYDLGNPTLKTKARINDGRRRLKKQKWVEDERLTAFFTVVNYLERHFNPEPSPSHMGLGEAHSLVGVIVHSWIELKGRFKTMPRPKGLIDWGKSKGRKLSMTMSPKSKVSIRMRPPQ